MDLQRGTSCMWSALVSLTAPGDEGPIRACWLAGVASRSLRVDPEELELSHKLRCSGATRTRLLTEQYGA